MTHGLNGYSGIIQNIFLLRNKVNRTHRKLVILVNINYLQRQVVLTIRCYTTIQMDWWSVQRLAVVPWPSGTANCWLFYIFKIIEEVSANYLLACSRNFMFENLALPVELDNFYPHTEFHSGEKSLRRIAGKNC